MSFPPNHNRLWDSIQENQLIVLICTGNSIENTAALMGRTMDSITARMAKLLRLAYYTSNEELIKLFHNKYLHSYRITSMNNSDRDEAYINAEFRLVVDGRTKDVATDETQAYQKAQALLRNCPTKEVILFQAVKRIVVPMNFAIEPFHKPA